MNLPIPADALFDLIVDTVCVVDAYGRFLYVSASGEQLFGYSCEEMRGLYMIELVHPDDRGRTLLAAARILAGKPVTRFENRYVRKDGSVVTIQWSACWSAEHRVRVAVARAVERDASDPRNAAFAGSASPMTEPAETATDRSG